MSNKQVWMWHWSHWRRNTEHELHWAVLLVCYLYRWSSSDYPVPLTTVQSLTTFDQRVSETLPFRVSHGLFDGWRVVPEQHVNSEYETAKNVFADPKLHSSSSNMDCSNNIWPTINTSTTTNGLYPASHLPHGGSTSLSGWERETFELVFVRISDLKEGKNCMPAVIPVFPWIRPIYPHFANFSASPKFPTFQRLPLLAWMRQPNCPLTFGLSHHPQSQPVGEFNCTLGAREAAHGLTRRLMSRWRDASADV